MKRSGMPRWRTALRPGGPLKRRTKLKRSRMRTLRPVQSPAEKHGKDVVRARSGGLCEACGMRRAESVHHRKNRSQGGTWDPSNLMHLCGDGTRGCHGWIGDFPDRARDLGWSVKRDRVSAERAVRRRGSWVLLADDGRIAEVIRYTGSPDRQCEWVLARPGGGLRCALGVLHDGDHECGLVTWPYTSEERASV